MVAFAVGAALAALAGLGGVAAIAGATLSQPAFALSVARDFPAARSWKRDAVALSMLWLASAALFAALLAWPLSMLMSRGTLGAALATSFAFALALLAAWRAWPLWQGLERDGGDAGTHWRALARFEPGAWGGLGAAAILVALAGLPMLLAWPGLLDASGRWIVALGTIVIAPLLHRLLQRMPAPALLPERWLESGFNTDGDADDASDVDAAGAPLLAPGESPEDALHAAARSGRVDRALALLDAGADPQASPPALERDQRSLLVLAAVLPDLRLLRALIGRGIDLNATHAGMTPLLAATRDSWHGRPEAVMTLLANGADPRARDNEGNTPLHHAARSSDPGVAALLRDAAAELEVCNNDGLTPMGVACASGNWRLARFLLERGAKAQSDEATPALIAAASVEEDDAAGVQLLLKHKARVDARDAHGRSALHEAAFAGHTEIIQALLAAHADPQARDSKGRTPLLAAARGARAAAIDALAAASADISAIDEQGRGALALACLADAPQPALVQRLLDLGADPEKIDRDGRRALDHAVQAGRWSLVAVLDPAYPLPAAVAADPMSAAQESATDNSSDGPPSPIDPEARQGLQDSLVFTLLGQGADALPELTLLLQQGHAPAGAGSLARFLGGCIDADAGARGLEWFAIELLERGADPFSASLAGDPPLALAVRLGWSVLGERLLWHGVDMSARDSHGMTALHLAAALGREHAIKLLVLRGASPEARAADGQTPLGVALSSGRRDLVDWLQWNGWPLPRRALQASDVPGAAIMGDADAVRRLLDFGFPIDAADAQGCTALLRA
ncbi:MAG: ankyrin repeat domain-containing protein, partial [Luteimonas sp.]